MELKEKAWSINPVNFSEPHFAPEDVYYSETQGKAKQKILSSIRYDDFKDYKGNEIGFLNLKVKRAKKADKYLVDGVMKTLYQIEYDERVRQKDERLDKLVSENPNAMAYIRKKGGYYCANYSGYTERLIDAGVYKIQDAARAVKNTSLDDHMTLIVIDAEEHNKMILSKIEQLKAKLI